jgi:hypothetical protein
LLPHTHSRVTVSRWTSSWRIVGWISTAIPPTPQTAPKLPSRWNGALTIRLEYA